VVLGCVCEAFAVDATVQLHTATDPAQEVKVSAMLLVGWGGGIVASMLIRPAYERRVLGREFKRNWPQPTELARALGARYALITTLILLGAVFAIVAIANALGGQLPRAIAPLAFDALLLCTLVPLIRNRRLSWRDLGIRGTLPPAAGYAVLALVDYLVAIGAWILIISPESSTTAATKLAGVPHQPTAAVKILLAFALAISAPVCEEIFFRGLLYRSLRNLLPLWPAALIAGSLFGLGHLAGYPLNTIPVKIVFGVLMCLLYERTGSILPCIAVHSFIDGSAADVALTGNDYLALAIAALVLLLVGAIALRRRQTQPPRPGPDHAD
jgi:membrane protease YdiL (CAAX protease family)